ncbi:hypothetical protein C1Y63_10025 [Corynebacterium sp. 13CS0277]|uniref:hypothetical protein n=1 Tax=Corynebacterium sp. 13CS0277 TaxID=2071994 RepID=UPI000D03EF7D|nr:hypothetical protein [Corynebacterium sp. 13CS0277]PRQ10705.1 hypothetical protein C1Y63_10025 [Corynebacterium sp. 13CS0277]
MLSIEEARVVAEKFINDGLDGGYIPMDAPPRAFGHFVDARKLEAWEIDPNMPRSIGGGRTGARVNCLTGEAVKLIPPWGGIPEHYPDWFRVSRELWRRMNEKGLLRDGYTGALVEPEDPDQPWLSL